MSPVEKAHELIESMMLFSCDIKILNDDNLSVNVKFNVKKQYAIKCALITIDEIIKNNPTVTYENYNNPIDYWNDVKNSVIYYNLK